MTPRRAALTVVVATATLLAVSAGGLSVGGAVVRLYLVVAAAALVLAFVSFIGAAVPTSVSEFDALLQPSPPRPARSPSLDQLERLLAVRPSAGDVHLRLRPVLVEIAAARLWTAQGIDLHADPEAARRLLDPLAWDLVRPDREPPADRLAPGPSLAALAAAVDALEALEWRR